MAALEILAAVLVILGLVVMTLGVYGAFHLPSLAMKLHAASKAIVLGLLPLLAAAALVGGLESAARAALVAGFLLLTTPVSSHVLAQAGRLRRDGAERRSEPS